MNEKSRHPSLARLLEATRLGPAALASELGESEQTITNWGSRGISKRGAIKAQKRFNLDADFILGDVHIEVKTPQSSRVPQQPNQLNQLSLEDLVASFGYYLESIDEGSRRMAIDQLRYLEKDPSDIERVAALIKVAIDKGNRKAA